MTDDKWAQKKIWYEIKNSIDIRDRKYIFYLIAFWREKVYQYKNFKTKHYLKYKNLIWAYCLERTCCC